uniref:Long-chain-fatty-acid--CoA ligase n=1 Tax=Albugo laibachii Nc14 TaxID=890382 RepID=F0W6V5_9STRA|nr:longchainfattyacidCoA ligase putative [Albugo laibachii Nc14]|eukprot:CCA16850.1 longchainfattyacidCoA ligase putative [Albugo laibachii Nc14]
MGAVNSASRFAEIDVDAYTGVKYSKEIPYSEEESRGAIRITETIPLDSSANTLYHTFQHGLSMENGQRLCYGTREILGNGNYGSYKWMTYKQVSDTVDTIAAGLSHYANIQRQQMVGIYSKNRVEWCLIQHACDRQAYVTVPLYDTLGMDAVTFIMNHTEMKVVAIAQEHFEILIESKGKCPMLTDVVQFEKVTAKQKEVARANGINIVSLDEVIAWGREHPIPSDLPLESDIATISYTSGTTGDPKGVILLHRNFACSRVIALQRDLIKSTDVHISYLPLPHVLERMVMILVTYMGASAGFYHGDMLTLLEDVAELKPTVFVSVPRLFNRVYEKITHSVAAAGGLKKLMFDQAFQSKQAYLEEGYVTHAFWDALVFSKIRLVLGGRVRVFVSGSAPLSSDVKKFLEIVFCCHVLEGYALTECSANATLTCIDQPQGPHVGIPTANTQIRLADVPEMNYTSKDCPRPRGEILVRSQAVFPGYYKDPEKTAETVDADGWLHTGDIGCWNADGSLSIIDRKKNIFKLAQGEYVAPEKIEQIYQKSKYVAQVFIYGDSLQSSLVAIVVPDPESAENWAVSKGITFGKDANCVMKLVQNPEFLKTVLADLEELAKQARLNKFEWAKRIYLYPHLFSVENGLITPTFKLKRPQLKQFFQNEINAMYQDINREG